MKRISADTPPVDNIERDYLDALERLQNGRPNDKTLKRMLKEGRLRINVSSVAKEARRSRTLLATVNGRYSRIRQLILLARSGQHTFAPRTAGDTISRLREAVASLKALLQTCQSVNLSYLERMRAAEREAESLRAALVRARAGKASSAKNVLHGRFGKVKV